MIDVFTNEKSHLINILSRVKERAVEIEQKYNVDLEEVLKKINVGIYNLNNEKFTIAFFGAFSDGKSTILSALTQRLDIKISPEPSTDKITAYPYGDYLIIDTPGLFSEHHMHDEMTRKYISEANVVIFTVSPTNPLKESHHPTIKWLMGELDKANSTIFVINKMDEVADLTDTNDFDRLCDIKKQVVKNTLRDILGVETNPRIVCIAADPAQLGLEHWLCKENIDQYQELSRIQDLKEMMDSFINNSKDDLINKAGISVIKDSIGKVKKQLMGIIDEIDKQKHITNNQIDELSKELKTYGKDISDRYRNIKTEILQHREHLLLAVEAATDIQSLRRVYELEIGDSGYILEEKINLIIDKYLSDIEDINVKVVKQIEKSVEFHKEKRNELLKSLSKAGAKFGEKLDSSSTRKIMSKLFEIRRKNEFLQKMIKFRTGGEAAKRVAKWADKLKTFGKILKGLPIIVESIDGIMKFWNQLKFESEKAKLKNSIEALFKDLLEDFTPDAFEVDYFSHVKDIKETIDEYRQVFASYSELSSLAQLYLNELSDILNELTEVSA